MFRLALILTLAVTAGALWVTLRAGTEVVISGQHFGPAPH